MPKNFHWLLLLIIIASIQVEGREKSGFAAVSEKKHLFVSQENIQRALYIPDIFYKNSLNTFQKSKYAVLFSHLYEKGVYYTSAVTFAGRSVNSFIKIKSTYGLLSAGKTDALLNGSYPEKKYDGNRESSGKKIKLVVNRKSSRISIAKNVVIVVLCCALVGSFLHFRMVQKKQRSKLRHIIRNQYRLISRDAESMLPDAQPLFPNISIEEVAETGESVKRRNESLMTSETEAKLLELLEDFEKGTLYNSKNMSLPFLAGEMNTNTKYLSYVINRHKSSDFKSYINRLRIHYMVDKLRREEKYRQYKISILADECGFSSHSKFASVFKVITDYSPSAYIKLLGSGNQDPTETYFSEKGSIV